MQALISGCLIYARYHTNITMLLEFELHIEYIAVSGF
jgi:hypothetical protein